MKNVKKTLFIINTMQRGGAAKMIAFVANTIAEVYDNINFVLLFDKEKTERLNSVIDQYPMGMSVHSSKEKVKLILKLRKQIRKINPNVVCAFVSDVAFYTRLATLGLKCKVVSAERGDPYTLPKQWVKRVRWAYKKSDLCVFQTEDGKNYFDSKTQNKSVVIPNPYIPTSKTNNERVIEKNKTIAAAGRLVDQKGFDILINSFCKIHSAHPEYQLVIYGGGPDLEKLQALVAELGLSDCVRFPGYVSDLQGCLRSDEIFVLSSRFEGIPNALIEAMAIGMPCVAMDCTPGGPKLVIGNSERGILVPLGDEVALTDAVCTLIEKPELRNYYASEAVKVKDMLAVDVIKDKWINCFKTIKD